VETTATAQTVKHIYLNRAQQRWEPVDLENLIALDHPARIIWDLSGRFDLSRFEQVHKTQNGEAGRPCWPARLLVSVWVYSYTMGMASARSMERMMSHEPGLRWLAAGEVVNHHTLSDFRVGHREALEDLFTRLLALLDEAHMVDLHTLLLDGTKVKAVAGNGSLHRRKTLEKRLRKARKVVRELDRRAASEPEPADERQRAAQARAAREALERAQAAMEKLAQLEAVTAPADRPQLRVSSSEADARRMKQGDGGIAPSYNVQVTTEARSRIIVGIGVTTASNDTQELMPAIERAERYTGHKPATVITDNGYATRPHVEKISERNIALVAPWKGDASREAGACVRNGIAPQFAPSKFRLASDGKTLICPAGKALVVIQQKRHHGLPKNLFRASEADCSRCASRPLCCGKRAGPRLIERPIESAAMQQYLARMQRPKIRALYRKRSEIAEFPHLWAKGVAKWRRFSVRGAVKAGMEALWVALSYNIAQWMRLQRAVPAAA